jgi:hypothetical protein
MCVFTGTALVSDTSIFARTSKEGRQLVVYTMIMGAKEDLAMILPIPVPKNTKEDAFKFINLEKYPNFFDDMRAGFPQPRPAMMGGFGGFGGAGGAPANVPLQVVGVGAYEASFVPTVKDFERLDEGFRLPGDVWEKLPRYKDFGFAVFKLKKGESQRVHPMAFDFPRADPKKMFFPTVHIHDGKIHARAEFDHALYIQPDRILNMGWKESRRTAGMFLKTDKTQGLVDARRHIYTREMHGTFKNEDVII